jgi:hypothetical protein
MKGSHQLLHTINGMAVRGGRPPLSKIAKVFYGTKILRIVHNNTLKMEIV